MKKNKIILALLLGLLIFAAYRNFVRPFGLGHKVIWSDSEGYYLYLPAMLIHQNFRDIPINSTEQYGRSASGSVMTKYNCGVAILELPFFLVAHTIALITPQIEANVYTKIYEIFIVFAALFYSFFGLWFLNKELKRRKIKELKRQITLGCLLFGTNLIYYSTEEAGMSHAFSFFLLSVFIFLTPRFYEQPTHKNWFIYGLVFGLIFLIRPTNAIIISLYTLFFGLVSSKSIGDRILFLFKKRFSLLVFIIPTLILYGIQLYLWYLSFDNFVWNGYDGSDPGFIYWKNPKMLLVLFDSRNSLFPYAPVLLLSLFGFFTSIKQKKPESIINFVIFILIVYLIGSWWTWTFSGSFGHRGFVEWLPILALPMAYFLEKIHYNKKLFKFTLAFIYFSCYFTLRLSANYSAWAWNRDEWTWNAFLSAIPKMLLL